MKVKVERTGGLSNMSLDSVSISTQDALAKIGQLGVDAMKQFTEPYDFRGNLSRSLMWKTNTAKGGNEGNDNEISDPEELDAVYIGSANDHAWFREVGTGKHYTKDKQEEFLRNIYDWCVQKLGFSPSDEPDRYWSLVNAIREHGTEAVPFALPAVDIIRVEGLKIIKGEVVKFWRERASSKKGG